MTEILVEEQQGWVSPTIRRLLSDNGLKMAGVLTTLLTAVITYFAYAFLNHDLYTDGVRFAVIFLAFHLAATSITCLLYFGLLKLLADHNEYKNNHPDSVHRFDTLFKASYTTFACTDGLVVAIAIVIFVAVVYLILAGISFKS